MCSGNQMSANLNDDIKARIVIVGFRKRFGRHATGYDGL